MSKSTVERLFWAINTDRPQIYKEIETSEADRRFTLTLSDIGIDFSERDELERLNTEIALEAEQHGFEQGLKLGFKLAFEIFTDKE